MSAPRPRRLIAGLLVPAALGACGREEPSADSAFGVPHVLVVTLDTLRADHLGCYGYFRDTSPTLDALAEESVLFEQCITPVSQTLPTHASIFTGLYPHEHGLLANVHGRHVYELAPELHTIAEALTEAGYETAGFVAADVLKGDAGISAGFRSWWETPRPTAQAEEVIDEVLGWLDVRLAAGLERPVMMWVHLFDPHAPYAPPPPYDTMFVSDERQAAHFEELLISEAVESHIPAFQGDARGEHNRYDGEVRYADAQLDRLFERLRTAGIWEETIVVVTGDHGEALKQHETNGHGEIWLETLRVPLLIKAPGLAPRRARDRIASVDVLPTAIHRSPALTERLSVWLAQATGRDALAPVFEPGPVFSQHPANRNPMAHAVVHEGWRLILGPELKRLYHLEADPHELNDLSEQHPERVERMSALLEAELAAQRARGEELQAGGLREATRERLESLEALGYGGDDEGD